MISTKTSKPTATPLINSPTPNYVRSAAFSSGSAEDSSKPEDLSLSLPQTLPLPLPLPLPLSEMKE